MLSSNADHPQKGWETGFPNLAHPGPLYTSNSTTTQTCIVDKVLVKIVSRV
jgi:hypothetical protein